MRILVVTQDYKPRLGGLATASFELARALAAIQGVEVRLAAPASIKAEDDLRADSHRYFETVRVPIFGSNFVAGFQWMFYLIKAQREWRPDVLLNMLWLPCSLGCWLGMSLGLLTRIPYFTLVHGVEVVESTRTLKKWLRSQGRGIKKRVIRGSSAVFSVSEFTRRVLLKECGLPEGQVLVVHNGIDTASFSPRTPSLELKKKWGTEGRFVFLTLSRLEDYKGVDRVLGALRRLSKEHPSVLYLVGGEGPDQKRLTSMVDQYGLKDTVRFLGRVEEEALTSLFNLCEVFVLLAREDWVTPNFEGFGIVLLEAAACGKPAIAGKSGGMPEVVQDRKTGWVVSPEDEEALYQVMSVAIEQEQLRAEFGRTARERAIQEFSWKKAADRILKEMKLYVRN